MQMFVYILFLTNPDGFLGLDCVYSIDMATNLVKTFGSRGNLFGRFLEPTSMALDRSGNIIVADSKNHRLQVWVYFCIFEKKRLFL